MQIKKTLIIFAILCLLSACGVEGNPASNKDNAKAQNFVTQTKAVAESEPPTSKSPISAKIEELLDLPTKNQITAFLDPAGFNTITHWGIVSNAFDEKLLYISDEFANLVPAQEYEEWLTGKPLYFLKKDDLENPSFKWLDELRDVDFMINDNLKFDPYGAHNMFPMKLNNILNLYSFIHDFNLSKMQVKEAIIQTNNNHDNEIINVHPKYEFSEEQMEALLKSDNIVEVTKLFAQPHVIVKGETGYPIGWFFYACVEDYARHSMTLEDLTAAYKVYITPDLQTSFAVKPPHNSQEYIQIFHPFTIDFLQYKLYQFSENTDTPLDAIDLCGYERDFSMPMAHEFFLGGYQNSYYFFYNQTDVLYRRHKNLHNYAMSESERNYFCIEKNAHLYSPHWVYYNKPSAYREAGITPDELLEMLPRYEALGILTDGAWAALENKIFDYAASFN